MIAPQHDFGDALNSPENPNETRLAKCGWWIAAVACAAFVLVCIGFALVWEFLAGCWYALCAFWSVLVTGKIRML